jgi:hypothetical protein
MQQSRASSTETIFQDLNISPKPVRPLPFKPFAGANPNDLEDGSYTLEWPGRPTSSDDDRDAIGIGDYDHIQTAENRSQTAMVQMGREGDVPRCEAPDTLLRE